LGYTVAQACKAIPCSRSHLHRAIKSGHLRAVKDGRKVLISRKAILDYLDRGDGEAEAEVDT
jgi:excisionase family DNA binding protein